MKPERRLAKMGVASYPSVLSSISTFTFEPDFIVLLDSVGAESLELYMYFVTPLSLARASLPADIHAFS